MFHFERLDIFETTENTLSKHEWQRFLVLSIVFQSTHSFSGKVFPFVVILTVLYFHRIVKCSSFKSLFRIETKLSISFHSHIFFIFCCPKCVQKKHTSFNSYKTRNCFKNFYFFKKLLVWNKKHFLSATVSSIINLNQNSKRHSTCYTKVHWYCYQSKRCN